MKRTTPVTQRSLRRTMKSRLGLTLVEVTVSIGLLSALGAAIAATTGSATTVADLSIHQASVETQLARFLAVLRPELRSAGIRESVGSPAAPLQASPGRVGDVLQYQVPIQTGGSYYDFTNGSVKVAKCLNAACTGASTITTLDSIGDVGLETSIAVGADGLPTISYYDITNGNLKTAKCVNAACTGAPTISTLDAVGDTGRFSSIVIGIDGLPIMSYYDFGNDDLRVAKCLNAACTGVPTLTTLDAVGLVGEYTSIAIGVDGLPIISYQDSANTNDDLKVAACGNIDCTGGASIVVVETPGNVGQFTALAIGADVLPIISHLDATNLDLRVAKCATTTCVG